MKKWLDQYQNGREVKNSLNRSVTCSNCGWSWKLSDGGMDPMTCHKCGGTIKMKNGGALDEYQYKGEVKNYPSFVLPINRGVNIPKNAAPVPVIKQGYAPTPYSEYIRNERNAEYERNKAMQNSDLARTFSSFTPGGDNIDAGVIGAEGFANLNPVMSGPILSASRLAPAILHPTNNDYWGADKSALQNTLGVLGAIGDVAMVSPYVKPQLSPLVNSVKNTGKNIKKSFNPLYNELEYLINKPKSIYDIKSQFYLNKELGEKINNDGSLNEGIFKLKRFPDYAVKIEIPEEVGRTMANPEYSNYNFVEATKNLSDKDFAKIFHQINLPGSRRALVMNKLNGLSLNDLNSSQFKKLPQSSIEELFKNLKNVRNENLGFDFMGDNMIYDPVNNSFKLFDLSPVTEDLNSSWNNYVLKDMAKAHGISNSSNAIKEAMINKLASKYANQIKSNINSQTGLKQSTIKSYLLNSEDKFRNRLQQILDSQSLYKYGGALDKYQDRGEVRYTVPTSDNLQYRPPVNIQEIPLDPFTHQPLTREQIKMRGFVPSSNNRQPVISQGTWKGNRTTKDNSYDPYSRIIEQDPQSEANVGKRMRKDFITKKVPAGVTAAAAIMAAPLAAPIVSAAMSAPLTIGSTILPYVTPATVIGAGFGLTGANNLANDFQSGYYFNPKISKSEKIFTGLTTGLDMLGTPGAVEAIGSHLITPAYRSALNAGKYLNKEATSYILSNRINNLVKNTDLSKLNNSMPEGLIPRLNLLDKSSVGITSDINELFKNNPEGYNNLINNVFNQYKDLYLRPIIRFKNTEPHSYIEDLTSPSKNKTLFKQKMCPPGSECAKTANSVNNYLYKELTGNVFDYNANAHNAWHMEDQMTSHGGRNVTPNIIIGDRILMGNGVDQSTYVPGMIADPRIRHAGVYAGDMLHNGQRIPMVMESGKDNPLFLNPIDHTFTGENSVLESVRPYQHDNFDYLKSLVEKNMRYAYRNKPSVYNSFSNNNNVQNILSNLEGYREEIKNTYDLTNDEFDQLRNSLIGIGAQETKLNGLLPGSPASKAKIQLQNILENLKLTTPIKQVKGNVGKILNRLNQPSLNLPPYPGSAFIEKEAAILSHNTNISFENALSIIKNKYQPKPKFSENVTAPSKGIFRQKFQTDQDILADVNSNNELRNAIGQMSVNYQKAKKLYPEATPSQLIDITTLMWNSPGKAANKELVDFYIFGKNNPNPSKFKFNYIDKTNKYKNRLIENPVNRLGLDNHFDFFNEQGPEIYYKQGGPIITNRGQWDYPGQTTIIPSNQITMQGVPYPVMGVDNTGYTKMMQPGMDYTFPGQYVTEYPMMQGGGQMSINDIKNAYKIAANNYNNRVFPEETLEIRKKAYDTIEPSDYTDIDNYTRWNTGEKRISFSDPRSEEAWKFYLGLNKPEDLRYLRKSQYAPTINATQKNYYSVDPNLEQDIFNSYKDKVKLNETLQTDESEIETPLSGDDGAAALGRFGVSRGHDDKGDYVSYYDKYDLKNFAQKRTKGTPYSIYGRIYYPKKAEGGEMIKRADGSYSRRGLWDNIRAAAGSGKKPTAQMLEQERKIRNKYQGGGSIPVIEGPSGYMNEDGMWVVDNETIKKQAKQLGAKKVLTEGGSLIIFDDNWNIVGADDNPNAPYKQGGSVTLNAGGEKHKIYVKTTNRGEGAKGHIMVNHPTMDKGEWDTIDLTRKAGATTIAQGVAATKKWHRENPYKKQEGGDVYWRTGQPMINDPSMDAISKVLLYKNQDKNFMQRAAGLGYQGNIPTKYINGQDPNSNNTSSLLMSSGDNIVFPTMIQTAPQQLSYQPNQYQEYIETPSWDIADYFATKGYKRAANDMYGMEYKNGGYVVKRSHDRKGKTHVVIGPDGTKKYFGDPNMGERSKSKYGKEAFYARHKSNLAKNPYFRAYARATWEEGGQIMAIGGQSTLNPVVKKDNRNWLEYLKN